jgi:SAM-dependent methyltransferase
VEFVDRNQQDKYVAAEFDRQAKHYDDSRVTRSFQSQAQALVLDEMRIEEGTHILDLGCGTGWAAIEIASRMEGTGQVNGFFWVQDICDDFILMKVGDLAGKLGERAHVGSATSQSLRRLLASAGFSEVEVKVTRLNWFWGIMIGKGVRRINLD